MKQEVIKQEYDDEKDLDLKKICIKTQADAEPPTTPSTPSRKRPRAAPKTPSRPTPKTPSKPAKKEQAAKKRQWKGDWKEWVEEHFWEEDSDYRQEPGSVEIHRSEGEHTVSLPIS